MAATFANWVGNQRCTPARRVSPASEAEVQAAVRAARAAGEGVRVVAAGHSFTPVHVTDGTLLDLARLSAFVLRCCDKALDGSSCPGTRRSTVWPWNGRAS